ncbi:type III PLP-dependent enzyme [Streptomyces sp. NPDC002521]
MSRYTELAERFGTPLYVYDLEEISAARAELLDALPEHTELYYAFKANPHPDLARELRAEGRGCRAEISSSGELAAALAAGFDAAECLYTGPGKTAAEIEAAVVAGVRRFSTDSVTDVRRVGEVAARHGVQADCLLRVNAVKAAAPTGIRMTGQPTQFGFDAEELPQVLPLLRDIPGARICGLHFFPLSNATEEASLIEEFRQTLVQAADLQRDLGLNLELLDIGGGFAAPYGTPGRRAAYPKLRTELEAALDQSFPGWRDGGPTIGFESGRFLTACAGTLLLSVSNVKTSRGRKFVILDGGINIFGGLSGLGRLLPVAVELADGDPVERASLVGPLCTPGDVLGREIELPALAPGDVVTVPNTGAYGPSASLLAFLGRPAPLEVVVRGSDVVSVSRIDYQRVHQ